VLNYNRSRRPRDGDGCRKSLPAACSGHPAALRPG
jgi:hypothetical protein